MYTYFNCPAETLKTSFWQRYHLSTIIFHAPCLFINRKFPYMPKDSLKRKKAYNRNRSTDDPDVTVTDIGFKMKNKNKIGDICPTLFSPFNPVPQRNALNTFSLSSGIYPFFSR